MEDILSIEAAMAGRHAARLTCAQAALLHGGIEEWEIQDHEAGRPVAALAGAGGRRHLIRLRAVYACVSEIAVAMRRRPPRPVEISPADDRFLDAWWDAHGAAIVSLTDLMDLVDQGDHLRELLASAPTVLARLQRLGRYLQRLGVTKIVARKPGRPPRYQLNAGAGAGAGRFEDE